MQRCALVADGCFEQPQPEPTCWDQVGECQLKESAICSEAPESEACSLASEHCRKLAEGCAAEPRPEPIP